MAKAPWETYEEVARHLLDQMAAKFNLEHVEDKQKVRGEMSGTAYTIDAKGVSEDKDIFLVVECRRHTTSRMKQEDIAALAYRIRDTGAAGGIIVSPLGLQEGAAKIAAAENIHIVTLAPESTTTDYVFQFLNEIRAGVSDGVKVRDTAIAVVKNVKTGDKRTVQ